MQCNVEEGWRTTVYKHLGCLPKAQPADQLPDFSLGDSQLVPMTVFCSGFLLPSCDEGCAWQCLCRARSLHSSDRWPVRNLWIFAELRFGNMLIGSCWNASRACMPFWLWSRGFLAEHVFQALRLLEQHLVFGWGSSGILMRFVSWVWLTSILVFFVSLFQDPCLQIQVILPADVNRCDRHQYVLLLFSMRAEGDVVTFLQVLSKCWLCVGITIVCFLLWKCGVPHSQNVVMLLV